MLIWLLPLVVIRAFVVGGVAGHFLVTGVSVGNHILDLLTAALVMQLLCVIFRVVIPLKFCLGMHTR